MEGSSRTENDGNDIAVKRTANVGCEESCCTSSSASCLSVYKYKTERLHCYNAEMVRVATIELAVYYN